MAEADILQAQESTAVTPDISACTAAQVGGRVALFRCLCGRDNGGVALLLFLPFSAPQITEQQMNSFVKYALPIAAFLFIVWWVWSAAKRQRKF